MFMEGVSKNRTIVITMYIPIRGGHAAQHSLPQMQFPIMAVRSKCLSTERVFL